MKMFLNIYVKKLKKIRFYIKVIILINLYVVYKNNNFSKSEMFKVLQQLFFLVFITTNRYFMFGVF